MVWSMWTHGGGCDHLRSLDVGPRELPGSEKKMVSGGSCWYKYWHMVPLAWQCLWYLDVHLIQVCGVFLERALSCSTQRPHLVVLGEDHRLCQDMKYGQAAKACTIVPVLSLWPQDKCLKSLRDSLNGLCSPTLRNHSLSFLLLTRFFFNSQPNPDSR